MFLFDPVLACLFKYIHPPDSIALKNTTHFYNRDKNIPTPTRICSYASVRIRIMIPKTTTAPLDLSFFFFSFFLLEVSNSNSNGLVVRVRNG